MNPEPKKVAANDKMRLLVMGHTEPVEWNEGKCLDSPTLMASTTKMMIALEDGTCCDQYVVEPDSVICDANDVGPIDGESEETTGDISSAFLTLPHYTKSESPRYVGYREYKGGPRVGTLTAYSAVCMVKKMCRTGFMARCLSSYSASDSSSARMICACMCTSGAACLLAVM